MQLIGTLDSPFVRRVAISMQLMDLPFEHQPLSVFRAFDDFARINPVVKAPTLIGAGGLVLMESSLILDHLESLVDARRSLMPSDPRLRAQVLRKVGLALMACEKAVQIVYERMLRPEELRHAPWVQRVTLQLNAALTELESELMRAPLPVEASCINQASVSAAVAWTFAQSMVPEHVSAARYPRLAAFTREAEQLPAFLAAPHHPSMTYRPKA